MRALTSTSSRTARRREGLGASAILVLLVVLSMVWAGQTKLALADPPAIYNLGTLGGTSSHGYSINASGQVAGFSDTTGDSGYHVFRYTGTPGSGGAMADLGTLGGTGSWGYAINESGQVAGFSDTTGDSGYHAFRYTGTPGAGGVMADLGTHGGTWSAGYAINASGQVAGYSKTTGDATEHAFLYTGTPGSNGAMADLGTLGGTGSVGCGINASGQVAGYSNTTGDSAYHAFRYTGTPGAGGVMADLGTLGGTQSSGRAINASGQVTGYSSYRTGTVATHAFLYTGTPGSGGAMADLGTLGGMDSYGFAINASGQVAGYSFLTGNNVWHAFLYTGTPGAGGRMIDLDAWLDVNNPTEGAKWTLKEARGLNDTGLITGYGAYNDGPGGLSDGNRAFILDASRLVSRPSGSTTPSRVVLNALPAKSTGARGVIFITHGWNSSSSVWADQAAANIAAQLTALGIRDQWDIVAYDWSESAGTLITGPGDAMQNAKQIGTKLGGQLRNLGYANVHLIGHSAGSWMIDRMADKLSGSGITVQSTFLDSYVPFGIGLNDLGDTATFAEQYVDRRDGLLTFTDAKLRSAYNVDVTKLDPVQNKQIWDSHAWPYQWYRDTTGDPTGSAANGWGFQRAIEYTGFIPSHTTYPRGQRISLPVNEPSGDAPSIRFDAPVNFASTFYATSSTGTVTVAGSTVEMGTGSPVWITSNITTADLVNFVTLDVQFTSAAGAEGLLSVYWDGQLLGSIDERYVDPGLQSYTLALPDTYQPGTYFLGLQLDPFTAVQSSATISNVATGYSEVPEPGALSLLGLAMIGLLCRRR